MPVAQKYKKDGTVSLMSHIQDTKKCHCFHSHLHLTSTLWNPPEKSPKINCKTFDKDSLAESRPTKISVVMVPPRQIPHLLKENKAVVTGRH